MDKTYSGNGEQRSVTLEDIIKVKEILENQPLPNPTIMGIAILNKYPVTRPKVIKEDANRDTI